MKSKDQEIRQGDEDKTSQTSRAREAPKRSHDLDAALSQYSAPWQYELSDRLSDDSDCLSISDVNGSSIAEMQCPQDVEESLARLMTAAPTLYVALQATPCLKADFEGDTCEFWNSNYGQELCQRCAALALANGQRNSATGDNND